jgi:hypothetical protein
MPYGRRQLLRALSFAFGSGFILRQNQFGATAQTAESKPASPAKDAAGPAIGKGAEMEKVMGLGGLFFRAHDVAVLAVVPAALGHLADTHELRGTSLAAGGGSHRLQSVS